MARQATKTERGYIEICRCERSGFSRTETSDYLGMPITEYKWKQALAWYYNQISVRTEIESVFNAFKQTQELKREAFAFFRMQRDTVMMDAKKINVRDIERLIDKELKYADRLRELAKQIVGDAGHDDIADLPKWIAEIEGHSNTN